MTTVNHVTCPYCQTQIETIRTFETESTAGQTCTHDGILNLREFYNLCLENGYRTAWGTITESMFHNNGDTQLRYISPNGQSAAIRNIVVVCQTCYSNMNCSICGNQRGYKIYGNHIVTSHIPAPGYICDNCLETRHECAECGSTTYGREYSYSRDYTRLYYCQDCYSHLFSHCAECGATYPNDDNDRCMSCRRRVIRNYHSSKSADNYHFYKLESESNPIFYGFELEVESSGMNCNEMALLIQDDFTDKVFMETDGSLNNGFEIISQPMSLKYHKTQAMWDYMLQMLQDNHFQSDRTSTCGLHVHIGIETLSKLTQIKLAYFLYKQDNLCQRIFRRGRGHYCENKYLNGVTDRNATRTNSRYDAISFGNAHTIEIRQAKGTLDYRTLLATLEFLDCVVHFAHDTSVCVINDRYRGYAAFVSYMQSHKNIYPNLLAHFDNVSVSLINR